MKSGKEYERLRKASKTKQTVQYIIFYLQFFLIFLRCNIVLSLVCESRFDRMYKYNVY